MRFQNWDEHLLLIDKDIFDLLPDGTILTSIQNNHYTKGKDKIDFDTRGGMLAFGFLHNPPDTHAVDKEAYERGRNEVYNGDWALARQEVLNEAARIIEREAPGARKNGYGFVADRYEYLAHVIRSLKPEETK